MNGWIDASMDGRMDRLISPAHSVMVQLFTDPQSVTEVLLVPPPVDWKRENHSQRQQQPLRKIHRDRLRGDGGDVRGQHADLPVGEVQGGVPGEPPAKRFIEQHSPDTIRWRSARL